MYLIIDKIDGHFEENNRNKYLVFDSTELHSTDENKEVLEIETKNVGRKGEYDKDFMKIKFNTDNNLPLNKPLKLHLLTTIVGCIFEEDGKFYLQLYLDDCLYELRVTSNI